MHLRRSRIQKLVFGILLIYIILFAVQQRTTDQNNQTQIDTFIVRPTWPLSQLNRLPNLSQLHWPKTQYATYIVGGLLPNGRRMPKPKPFEPSMTPAQRDCYWKLLRVFTRVMLENKMGDRFWVHAGTLVGSLRHHDVLPWDDEIDVMVDWEVRDEMIESLQRLKPEFNFVIYGSNGKLSTRFLHASEEYLDIPYSRRTNGYDWGWPFLDIGFYRQNATRVWEVERNSWPREVVFPLLFRPFGSHWYPTPNSPLRFLRYMRAVHGSCLTGWNHIFEKSVQRVIIDCFRLAGRYAFVQRTMSELSSTLQDNDSGMVFVDEHLILEEPGKSRFVYHTLTIPVNKHEADVPMYT